jgi:hypothetical protein
LSSSGTFEAERINTVQTDTDKLATDALTLRSRAPSRGESVIRVDADRRFYVVTANIYKLKKKPYPVSTHADYVEGLAACAILIIKSARDYLACCIYYPIDAGSNLGLQNFQKYSSLIA